MKVALVSDLHLEFADLDLENAQGAHVLLLAGDILTAVDLHDYAPDAPLPQQPGKRQLLAARFREFLDRVSARFPHVIYVAGNHEFYGGTWDGTLETLATECARYPNVYFLENGTRNIDGVTFVGCTLWTDMNRGDPLTLYEISRAMNDYRMIRDSHAGYKRIRPQQTVDRHRASLQYISDTVAAATGPVVVVGHMSPSSQSVHPKWAGDRVMNGAYHSNLADFILDRPQIHTWVHGHTHESHDYMIGSARILCNPRGYVGYERGSQADDPYVPALFEV